MRRPETSGRMAAYGERLPLATICGHEAAHAVMRWLRGTPVTGLSAGRDGGRSVGAGGRIRKDDFMAILLAGHAWECRNDLDLVDLDASKLDDIERARAILADTPHLRGVARARGGRWRALTVEEGLLRRFRQAAESLAPYESLVKAIASRLEQDGRLSGRDVRAMIAHWEKAAADGTSPSR